MMDACLPTEEGPCTLRLHVGGFGPSVISSDLVQTFSSLVNVSCVDIVRTKGRNFAYVTIQAASPRDVKRLFSLYNGCIWKGGRLKLEKAKELYVEKLRREWAERDCLEDINDSKCSQDQGKAKHDCLLVRKSIPKKENPNGFNIYLPKLKKVKKIPDKGLGKHKRSFERVEALPCSLLRLCNCREDCMGASSEQAKIRGELLGVVKKQRQGFNTDQAGVPWNEQSMANSKDLERKFENVPVGKSSLDASKGAGDTGVEPDKPILNIGGFNGTKSSLQEGNSDPEWTDEEGDSSELVLNLKGIVQSHHEISQRKAGQNMQQQQQLACKEDTPEEQRKRVKLDPEALMNSVSRESEGVRAQGTIDPPSMQTYGLSELKSPKEPSGMNWVQKGSWKSLVGGTGHFSFRLGGMLDRAGGLSSPLVSHSNGTVPSELVSKQWSLGLCDQLESSTSGSSHPCDNVVQGCLRSSRVDQEGTPFMKSDKSRQAWLESKRAAKNTLKRVRKDALRTTKLLH